MTAATGGRVAGKTIMVTGAARGLGAAVARRFGAEGARLALTDLDPVGLDATIRALQASGTPCVMLAGDIRDPATSAELVSLAEGHLGPVDVLVNVAGISPAIALDKTTADDFDRIMGVNCLAQLLAIQAVRASMTAAGRGSIVNISSVGALVALPHLAAYSASKAAVLGLTRGVACELAEFGIRCNAICPGGIDTPMAEAVVASFPDRDEALSRLTGRQLFKRFATPDEIAGLVLYLASDESSFVTGAILSADGGHTAW
jgi:NAD(P)-dependent dehydrogenase (short-subunit alcohol dehydrogenase family)